MVEDFALLVFFVRPVWIDNKFYFDALRIHRMLWSSQRLRSSEVKRSLRDSLITISITRAARHKNILREKERRIGGRWGTQSDKGIPWRLIRRPYVHQSWHPSVQWGHNDSGLEFNCAQMIYYLIFRHIPTTKNCPNLLTNLQQPRRIYARKSHLRTIESQSWVAQLWSNRYCSTLPLPEGTHDSVKFVPYYSVPLRALL